MRKFFIRGGHSKTQFQLVVRALKGCLQPLDLAQGGESRELRSLTRAQSLLTFTDDFLSDRTGLVITAPLLYFGPSSAWRRATMFTQSVVPRTLLRQGLHGLLGSGERVVGRPVNAPEQKLRWVSCASYPAARISLDSDCLPRSFGTKARGRRMKDVEMVSGEGVKQKGSKTKRGSVEASGAHLASDEMAEAEDADRGPSTDNCGGIHVIIGPMFAGKSTALLHRVQEEASVGRKVALVKSDKDTRYGLSSIVTHDGLQMPCYAVPDLATFKTKVGGKFYKELDVIGIDEAQFFADLYEFCQHAADFEGKTIIVAGLDGDFLRRKFGSTLDLIPAADSVVKLSSRCEICGRPAIFSFRKTLDTHTELVGGAEVYMPVCRQHFVNGQIVVETASTVIGAHQVAQMNNE